MKDCDVNEKILKRHKEKSCVLQQRVLLMKMHVFYKIKSSKLKSSLNLISESRRWKQDFFKILKRGSNFVLKLVLVFTASGKSAQNCEVKTNYSELDSERDPLG